MKKTNLINWALCLLIWGLYAISIGISDNLIIVHRLILCIQLLCLIGIIVNTLIALKQMKKQEKEMKQRLEERKKETELLFKKATEELERLFEQKTSEEEQDDNKGIKYEYKVEK